MAKIDFAKIAVKAAGATGGGAIAQLAMNKIGENVNPIFKASGLVVIGAIMESMDKKKDGLMGSVGLGIAGAAGATLINNFLTAPATSGVGYADDVVYEELSGLEDENSALQGLEDENSATY